MTLYIAIYRNHGISIVDYWFRASLEESETKSLATSSATERQDDLSQEDAI